MGDRSVPFGTSLPQVIKPERIASRRRRLRQARDTLFYLFGEGTVQLLLTLIVAGLIRPGTRIF
jgi:hypothetical protein